MKSIKLKYEIINTKVVAKIDGCDILLQEEQLLDYLHLLDLQEIYKTLTNSDNIIQIKDMIQRIEKRLSLN